MKFLTRQFLTVFILIFSSAALIYGCNRAAHSPVEKAVYQCSMHPAITSERPGDCPICHMRLTKVDHVEGKRKVLFYRHPMNPKVSSPVPAKDEMGMDYIPVYEDEQGEAGSATVDGRAMIPIDPARIQQIGVKITEAKNISLEMNVRTLGRVAYDPDLHNTIGEYREAVAEYIKSKNSSSTTIRDRAEEVMKLADLKLRLAGISAEQMDHLKSAGQSTLRLLTLRHSAAELTLPPGSKWIYADLYENESDLAAPGQKVMVTTPALAGKLFQGTVRTADLIPNALIRTMRVRAEILDPEDQLREGMSVDVVFNVVLGEKLAVPVDAVLNTGQRTLVFVVKGEGKFEPREVRVGREADGFNEIVSGLAAGEKVVSSANFLIDSESRIRAALQSFGEEGHHHG